jgi:hypothetical protein
MAAAVPNTDITAMLGSLLEIIQKYEDNDPENPPKEGDYLLAMNTLKALNDRKGGFGAVHNQMVVVMRERIRRIPNLLEITQRHAGWMMKKLMGYMTCDVCGSQLKDEYALNRHKKRATCRVEAARRFFFSERFLSRVKKWQARGFNLDFPFVSALFGIIEEAQPVILLLQRSSREFITPSHMVPRRLLPQMLWESMWSHTAQDRNPRYAFCYEPHMFCAPVMRDGPTGFLRLFRGSILPQGRKLYLQPPLNQLEMARRLVSSLNAAHDIQHYENWNVCMTDRLPLVKMLIAPRSRPRFKAVPEVINFVSGAHPITQFPAELANFSTILPPEPAAAPAAPPVVASGGLAIPMNNDSSDDEEADNYNV